MPWAGVWLQNRTVVWLKPTRRFSSLPKTRALRRWRGTFGGGDGSLRCAKDNTGLAQETDPFVHVFARTDSGPVPNCASNQLLSMNNGRLVCQFDSIGITERQPQVAHFARIVPVTRWPPVRDASAGSQHRQQRRRDPEMSGNWQYAGGVLALDDHRTLKPPARRPARF